MDGKEGSVKERGEVWVAIPATDRPASLELLCKQLVDRAARAEVPLRVLVAENSRQEAHRAENQQILAGLPVAVEVESTAGGESISVSRMRLRTMIASALRRHGRPRLVWMLDDDVRLSHVLWDGSQIADRPLHNHIEALLGLHRRYPELDVLVGEVTGDPPIPAFATLATRLTDLAHNLRLLLDRRESDPWRVPEESLRVVSDRDAYYDLSLDRSPAWLQPVTWLPRARDARTADVWRELAATVSGIPFGVASTRPVLARQDRFDVLDNHAQRGGNAVFFDVDACLEHEYPSMDIAGVTTRRGDMVGTRLLQQKRPGRVMASAFSVAHARPTEGRWPTRAEMQRAILGDTFGALLAREVDAAISGVSAGDFVAQRAERLRLSAHRLRAACGEVGEILDRTPCAFGWSPEGVRVLLDWVVQEVPTGGGVLPRDLEVALGDVEVHANIAEHARALVGRN